MQVECWESIEDLTTVVTSELCPGFCCFHPAATNHLLLLRFQGLLFLSQRFPHPPTARLWNAGNTSFLNICLFLSC